MSFDFWFWLKKKVSTTITLNVSLPYNLSRVYEANDSEKRSRKWGVNTDTFGSFSKYTLAYILLRTNVRNEYI